MSRCSNLPVLWKSHSMFLSGNWESGERGEGDGKSHGANAAVMSGAVMLGVLDS